MFRHLKLAVVQYQPTTQCPTPQQVPQLLQHSLHRI